MSCAKAVIGSNRSSIPEIIGREDCLFEPNDTDSIAITIEKILKDDKFRKELEVYFLKRSKKFSWENSAKKAIKTYQKLQNQEKKKIYRKKIAFFTPLPPLKSGISDYSADLLPFLQKYCDVDIYIDDYDTDVDIIRYNFNIYNYKLFESMYERYDEIIYQFGNSQFHAYMYDIALKYPGIVVLHDFFLSGLINYIAQTTSKKDLFLDSLVYSHGDDGKIARDSLISSKITLTECIKRFPVNKELLGSAKTIIAHSKYSKDLANKYYGDSYDIVKINQLIKPPSFNVLTKKSIYKDKLDLKDCIVISAFGHIAQTKQYDFILKSISKSGIFDRHNVKLVFVGEFADYIYKKEILHIIKKYDLDKHILVTGFVDDKVYKEYLLATDIAINLRKDSRGETSRALLMNMAYALPTIVNDYATFSELPDDTVAKVTLSSESSFINILEKLITDSTYRDKISKSAYQYIKKYHNISEIAQQYYDIIMRNSDSSQEVDEKSHIHIKNIANIIVENDIEELNKTEFKKIAKILKGCQNA